MQTYLHQGEETGLNHSVWAHIPSIHDVAISHLHKSKDIYCRLGKIQL